MISIWATTPTTLIRIIAVMTMNDCAIICQGVIIVLCLLGGGIDAHETDKKQKTDLEGRCGGG